MDEKLLAPMVVMVREVVARLDIDDAAAKLARLDDELARTMHLHELVHSIVEHVWELAGPFEHVDGAREVFTMLLMGDVLTRVRALSPTPLESEGPAGDASTPQRTPLIKRPRRDGYVLVYDPLRQVIVCVTGIDHEYGRSWRWLGSHWEIDNAIPHAVPDFAVAPQGILDPTRNGVACWAINHSGEPVGILINRKGARLIEHRGDIPRAVTKVFNESSLVFAVDQRRDVTIALGRDALWELDRSDTWRRVTAIDEWVMPPSWFPGSRIAVDAPGRVIMGWVEWDGTHAVQLRAWDGTRLTAIERPAGWPESPSLYNHSGRLAMIRGNGASPAVVPLDPRSGIECRLPADLRRPTDAHVAWDPGRNQLLLGPGSYEKRYKSIERADFTVVDTTSGSYVVEPR